jgi:N6-L-threonylcarbamoyladenine synthase
VTNRAPLILALESSCDETAAALVEGSRVLASEIASQIEIHARFGGVVPELASRHHLDALIPVLKPVLDELAKHEKKLADIDAFAVTHGPGLVGALLIGVQAARGLAAAVGKPLYGIHHLEGHLCSTLLAPDENENTHSKSLSPHLALIASGGHALLVDVQGVGKYTIIGQSRDDAVGEAYDKAAKLLGLGYPGGPIVDRLAAHGRADAHRFPRAWLEPHSLDFSFSGLKTSLSLHLNRNGQPQDRSALADLCASFQEAIIDVLIEKTRRALLQTGHKRLHVVGGVAANSRLRTKITELGSQHGLIVAAPPLRYCGDNAAMIAVAASLRWTAKLAPTLDVDPGLSLDD